MHADTFWGVFTPILVLCALIGLPRWGAARWFALSPSKGAALLLLVCGFLAGAIPAFFEARRLRATIFEEWMAGNAELAAGPFPPIVRQAVVRRPGAPHHIVFLPAKRVSDPSDLPEVAVDVVLYGPDGKEVATFNGRFHAVPSSVEEDVYSYSEFEDTFSPKAGGPHKIVVTYRSPGIPQLLLRIEDG